MTVQTILSNKIRPSFTRTTKQVAFSALVAACLAMASSNAHAVVLLGSPFTPSGADYQIYALQGIDASNPTGKSGFNPQVNRDFEFQGATGVSYDKGGGQLTDFGLGLYFNGQNQVQSTGLKIQYNQSVMASSVTLTVEDFDIKAGAAFFNPQKVEPGILLLGANNSIYASASPTDIFKTLSASSNALGKAKGDVWDINLGQLLNVLNKSDASITGVILYADALAGERPNSDPYLLVGASHGMPCIPEPSNYLMGLSAIVFGGLFQIRQLRLHRKALKA